MWRALVVAVGCGVVMCAAACVGGPAGPVPATPGAAEPGLAWASFIRDDCEWSGPETPPAICFGNRGAGFRVRAVRRDGARWYIWDPSTNNFAYVDRAALSLPAELVADEPPLDEAAKTAVICVDRSSGYRYTATAKSALGAWILQAAHPGDVFYLRWIEESSYPAEAEAVPAVRVAPAPTRTALDATPGPPNPFDIAQVAHATATVRAIQDQQTSAAATEQAALRAASDATSRAVGAFLQLEPPPAASGDVIGCVRKASELLAGAASDRYLIVASAAADQTPTLPAGVRLDRVQIRFVFFQCDSPDRCDRAKQGWSALAAAANAANIRFSDPSEGLGRIDS